MAIVNDVPQLVDKKEDDIMEYVISCVLAKETWTDMVHSFEGGQPNPKKVFRHQKALITTPSSTPISTALFSNNVIRDFQENSDDKVDERSSEEYLRDLDIEYHERPLLANSKPDLKFQKDYKAEYRKMKAKLTLFEASPLSSQNPKIFQPKNKGLVAETFDWDEEEVFDEEEVTQVTILMALANDEITIGKYHARNGEWVDITIRKVNTLLSMDEDTDWQNYLKDELLILKQAKLDAVTFQIQNTELIKLNHALQEQLKKEKKINEKWLTSSKKGASPSSEVMPLTLQPHSPKERPCLGIMKHTKPEAQDSSNKNVSGTVTVSETKQITPSVPTKRHIRELVRYLDSGCTRSMTGVKSYLHKYVKQPGPKVVFGDNSSCITEGYGSINCGGFQSLNTRRQQIEGTYHVTFDESMEAIRFTNTLVDEIGIDDSSRYPPDEFLEDDPSRQYQVDSDVSYYIDTKGPLDLINTEGTHEQNIQNDQMITQPTDAPSGNNTKGSGSITEPLVLDVTQSHIPNQASLSSHPIPEGRCSRYQHIELIIIIGNPGEGMLTRSMAAKLTATSASECLFANFLSDIEPKKVSEALKHPGWINAIQEELNQFYRNKIWTLEEEIDYDETFIPVERMEAIRIFLAFATYMNFKVYQMDVKSAFLNGKLKEEVYVKQPPGFESSEFPNYVVSAGSSRSIPADYVPAGHVIISADRYREYADLIYKT
ncbi:retrovirus-related pol polyprotein from transposon TNT 1-94 [Tanacetum coccineum]